jgi:hypothetical protein
MCSKEHKIDIDRLTRLTFSLSSFCSTSLPSLTAFGGLKAWLRIENKRKL